VTVGLSWNVRVKPLSLVHAKNGDYSCHCRMATVVAETTVTVPRDYSRPKRRRRQFVAVFGDYSRRFWRVYLQFPAATIVYSSIVTVPGNNGCPKRQQSPFSATIVAVPGDYSRKRRQIVSGDYSRRQSGRGLKRYIHGQFDSRFDSNRYARFDSNANGRFAGSYSSSYYL